MLKNLTQLSWYWFLLVFGSLAHLATGKTPKKSHLSVVGLFCKTQGRANDFLSTVLSKIYPPYKIEETSGVLQSLSTKEQDEIQNSLEKDGYHVFKERLSPEFCERILQQSLKVDCFLSGDEVVREKGRNQRAKYDRNNPRAAFYILPEDDITDMKEVQELVCDPTLIKVAQRYLNANPFLVVSA
ncbi:hypothetical protein GALL_00140 [mine drainage metagenome]|uniref:Uncharacterized protein n=1 Tax=mine drainage metagenome TaxID=410659 RepID=A0A1J5TE15_9ZZZZ